MEYWDIIKSGIAWIVMPLIGFVVWFFKKQHARMDGIESGMNSLQVNHRVTETKIDGLKEVMGIEIRNLDKNIVTLTATISDLTHKLEEQARNGNTR